MFEQSAELKMVLDTIREFVREEIVPLERPLLQHDFDTLWPALQEKRAKAKRLGLWLPQIPQAYGGMGLSLVEHGYVSQELGWTPLGHYVLNCQAPDAGNMEILIEHGTPEQKERFLQPLLAGEIRSCFSMTEPEHPGSNPTWMSTTAVKDGDDYVINGHKWFTSSADGAAFAIVMAITNPDASRYQRASQIIVPTDTPGFQIVQNISVMGERGIGWASHAEVRYTNCRVPRTNLLGAEGAGFAIAQERLGPGRIHHCMRWIGICERALDLMCRQATLREVAPGRRLADQQTIQNWIAESRAEINAARLMVLDAAHKIDREGTYAARVEISAIKFYVAGVLQKVLDRAIQAHGALGMTDELPLAYWYRHERAARIYDGPDEVHKMVVARHILRQYAA
ncbi:MAG: acyl-CoA dehydrogenase [Chloroflexi bacterium]|nr:MAG: acyl-CoA dehydrogenase [Chloroflexota bacterium]